MVSLRSNIIDGNTVDAIGVPISTGETPVPHLK
jgi:hypothetical protein